MPQTPVTDYTKVSTTVLGAQFAPAVTALSGGGYVIVWQDSSAGAIYAQRYNASGQPVGTELHLDSTQGGSPLWVSVAATAGDGFVIAYQAGSFANAEIYAHRYDSSGSPSGGIFAVNTTTPNEQYNPHITALENGALLFTWDTQALDVFQEVRGRIYTSDGQALGNDFVVAPMSATVENGFSAIASLPGGGFVVTWQTGTPMGTDNFEIVAQRFTSSGAAIGSPFQVNTSVPNSQFGNDVARLSDGGFVVTWVDAPGSNGGGRILARHYDASGVAIGGEILIDSKATGGYGRTVVTALANGAYVVGWMEADTADNNVLARQMGSNDVPVGAAFEMAFNSPFGANFFSDGAVTLANGNVVFTWDGPSVTPPGGQGTGEDVYMRVYNFSAASPPGDGTPGPDRLDGTSGDDTLNGLGGNDILKGMDGSDTLDGGDGDDVLDGGAGVDRTVGGTGNDTHVVDNALDVVEETAGGGTDLVYASVDYTLGSGVSVEALLARDNSLATPLSLIGNELANTILGNNGANFLDGGAGADILGGYGGNDTYAVDNPGDQVIEGVGGGTDTVYASISYQLAAGSSVEVLGARDSSLTTALALIGNELDNTILGNNGANFLDGGAGADILAGYGGNDVYAVDNAGDAVFEDAGGGNDTVYATANYVLNAGASVEVLAARDNSLTTALNLTGNEQAQTILGNNGANILNGGAGADVLAGYGGADTFAFTTALGGGNVDVIADFTAGTDKIALDDAIFTGLGLGALGAGAFVTGAAAADGDDRIIYNSATGQLFFDADGNGAGAAVLFATLLGNPALAASDFQVI
jgi:Ca2+-binding RTX toxin-like protein